MAYIIAEPCLGTKDTACVEVCPVDCIYDAGKILYIHPEECINCALCEPACPVDAVFEESATPPQWEHYIEENKKFFEDHPDYADREKYPIKKGEDYEPPYSG
jgi:NAD-dependent dihydropyrimidine dehydrogenase PreA subunit